MVEHRNRDRSDAERGARRRGRPPLVRAVLRRRLDGGADVGAASVHQQIEVAVVPLRGERDGLQGAADEASELAVHCRRGRSRQADARAGGLREGRRGVHGDGDRGHGQRGRADAYIHADANAHA